MLQPNRIPSFRCQLVRDGHLPVFFPATPIDSAQMASRVFMRSLRLLPHEELHVIFVNGGERPSGFAKLSQGGHHGCSVTARDLLRLAIAANAAAVILGHNHPSGDPNPSNDDIDMTKHMIRCCDFMGIPLLDHLIVCPEHGRWRSIMDAIPSEPVRDVLDALRQIAGRA